MRARFYRRSFVKIKTFRKTLAAGSARTSVGSRQIRKTHSRDRRVEKNPENPLFSRGKAPLARSEMVLVERRGSVVCRMHQFICSVIYTGVKCTNSCPGCRAARGCIKECNVAHGFLVFARCAVENRLCFCIKRGAREFNLNFNRFCGFSIYFVFFFFKFESFIVEQFQKHRFGYFENTYFNF